MPRLLIVLVAWIAVFGGAYFWWKQPGGAGAGPAAGASRPAASGVAAPVGAMPASGIPRATSEARAAGETRAGGPGGRRFGPGPGPGAGQVQPVSVATVRQQDLRVTLGAIGNISALNTAVVRAKVEGELRALRFREGELVKAGQLLAEIDPRSYQVALSQAQGQLARDQAQLKNAQLDLQRYRDLLAKDSIAQQEVDTQEALVRQLQGTLQATQAQVDSAQLQLSHTRVTAPISGRLGLRSADLGNMVRPGDTSGIVTITQTQPIAVVFALPEAHLAAINRKLRAGETLTAEAWDREQKNRLAQGRVITIDNAIDAASGTIKVKAEFPNADGTLFPNQFVNIRMLLETQAGARVVPSSAVQRGAQGLFVYVVREDGSVNVRRVRLGAADGELVGVEGELAPGERVVTDGADRLREGAKVEVIAAAAAASAPARPARTRP